MLADRTRDRLDYFAGLLNFLVSVIPGRGLPCPYRIEVFVRTTPDRRAGVYYECGGSVR